MQTTQINPSDKMLSRSGSRGFTILELMTVVAIIVVLIAILIPTLSRAKDKAREAATRSLMSSMASSLETYYTVFHAYPGPMPTGLTSDTTTGSKALSGSQNMLLGLSYPMAIPSNPGGGQNITGTNVWVNPTQASGPLNYAVIRPNGMAEQLSPFFSPSGAQLSKPNGLGFMGLFPAVVDTFPEGLPILYYRRTPGVDNPVSKNPTSQIAAYYLDENNDYTGKTALATTIGTTYDQTQGSYGAANTGGLALTTAINDFTEVVGTGTSTITARGGYVLISAGIDRIYGKVKGKYDDLTQVGGN